MSTGAAPRRIAGIDVGGTFTDLIVVDDASGDVRLAKVPTTVDNQAFGVLAAIAAAGVDAAALDAIVHGTTTTTNAMLERKIATVVGTFAIRTSPLASSTTMRSVNVPPTSMPAMRRGNDAVLIGSGACAAASRPASAPPCCR